MGLDTEVGTFEAKMRALTEGFIKHYPASDQEVLFGGKKTTVGKVVAALKGVNETLEAVHRANLAFRHAVDHRRKSMKELRATYEDAVCFLKFQMGRENPKLGAFGIDLPKPRKRPSNEVKALAAAKRLATRRARGTMGPKQRLALGKAGEPRVQLFGSAGQAQGPTVEVSIELQHEPKPEPEGSQGS